VRTVLFILALLCGYQSIAQLSKTSLTVTKSIYTIKGDYYSQHRNYVLAVNTYNKAIQQNPKEVPAMLGMADAYHMLGKDDLAARWYQKALTINSDVGAEYILKYITILSTLRNPTELRHWVTLYNSKVTKTGELMDSVIFVTENLTSLNSKSSDSAPLLYDNKMIFSSDRAVAGNFNSYKSILNSEGFFGEVSPLHPAVNPGHAEGGFAIATKSATFFFTGTEKESTTTPPAMEIFSCTIPNDPSVQLKINKFTFKNFDHSMAQPTVNSDGTVLYFTAHSPKQTRGFDLYHSQYNGKKWSPPVALGTTINSHGDELYPMLVNDSILYFASNGHGGLGGFDIFKINLKKTHHQPEHLPAPINSPADEFGFVMNSAGNEYYLSSNRPGGLGGNDIYRIYSLPLKKKKHDAAPKLEELFIYTSKGDEIKLSGSSKENLKFDFQPGQKYNLTVEYDNFRTGTTRTTKNATAFTKLNFYTFDIQKTTETVYDQKGKSKPVQDIHINPGDLVTFQLTPNMVQDPDADVSKIQFQKMEAVVADGQSIVFSYIADGGPGIPEGDMLPVADLSKLDTVSRTQPAVVKAPTEKSSQVVPTSIEPVLTTITPASQKVSALDTTVNNKSTNSIPVQSTVKAPDEKSSQALPTSSEPVLTTITPASQMITAPNTTDINKSNPATVTVPVQPTTAKAIDAVPIAIVGTQQEKPKSEQAQNDNVVSSPTTSNEVVATAKTDQKNPIPKKANDTTSNKPSIITKANVVAQATETQKVNQAVANATTQISPNQNNASQATPLVSANFPAANNATDIQYRVQIAASKSKLSDDQLKKIYRGPSEIHSFSEEGYQKYYIEQTPSFPIAKRTLNESGVPQAFIAAYQGEKKLNLLEAIAQQKKNKTLATINEPEIKSSGTEQLSIVNTQPNNSPEVLTEPSKIASGVSKEMPTAVGPTSKNIPASDSTQETGVENKIIVTNVVTKAPVETVPTQAVKEVEQEKIVPVTTETNKELQATDSPDVTTQSITAENKPPITNSTDKSISNVNAQSSNSKEVTSEKIATDTTASIKEKQVMVATPAIEKTLTKVPAPDVKTPGNTVIKKPSHDIAGRDDFSYRLQIAASEAPLNDSHLKKIYQGDKEVRSFKEDGKYKYYILETSNYFVARQMLKEANVSQAFISAYKKDVKVPLEEAINDQYKVPAIRKDLNEMDSVIKITTVNFELDKFELQAEQLDRLRNTAISELTKNPSYRVIVNGYTDIRGSETYNFGLSQERALFVARQIVAEGIDAERVATHYFGESQLAKYCPEHETCDESIHQANRRVEILLLVSKKSK